MIVQVRNTPITGCDGLGFTLSVKVVLGGMERLRIYHAKRDRPQVMTKNGYNFARLVFY
jgi:hypothetical protein